MRRKLRDDFRQPGDVRPLSAELGLVCEASGSARFALGNTAVVAAVFGPGQPKFSRLEEYDRASVEVDFAVGHCSAEAKAVVEGEGQRLVKALVLGCVILTDYPRLLLHVRVDVERDAGSVLAAALNATVLALMDAGVAMYLTPAAMAVLASEPSAGMLVDPLRAEEAEARQRYLFSFGNGGELLLADCSGAASAQELESAVALARGGAAAVRAFFLAVMGRAGALTEVETVR